MKIFPSLPQSRRQFLKSAGAAGLGSLLLPLDTQSQASSQPVKTIGKRPFGKSGTMVSMLALGGMFDIPNNQLLLKQALRWGVTYWDTADCYGGGASEEGIGKFLASNPQERGNIFLVSKSDDRDPDGMDRLLKRSLKRLNTSYIDLYLVHGLRSIDELSSDLRKYVEKIKSQGLIRLFGFSTHSNMEKCLKQAAKLGWIDGIMMSYNFRLMHSRRMKEAVLACHAAGIGLTAMKTQGGGAVKTNNQKELDLAGNFLTQGYTDFQAKLKAIWANPKIASVCSQMPNMTILMANIAGALDRTRISANDLDMFREYALETRSDYCAGCADICENCLLETIPISDIMRFLMYSRSYGDHKRAVTEFKKIAPHIRNRLADTDFGEAERKCPQNMQIGKLMKEALSEFT